MGVFDLPGLLDHIISGLLNTHSGFQSNPGPIAICFVSMLIEWLSLRCVIACVDANRSGPEQVPSSIEELAKSYADKKLVAVCGTVAFLDSCHMQMKMFTQRALCSIVFRRARRGFRIQGVDRYHRSGCGIASVLPRERAPRPCPPVPAFSKPSHNVVAILIWLSLIRVFIFDGYGAITSVVSQTDVVR